MNSPGVAFGDLAERWRRSPAIQMAGAMGIGHVLALLTMPLVTRLYGAESVGVFGLLMAFVNFASVGTALRYDIAIVGASDEREASRLAVGAAVVTLPVSLALGAFLLLLIRCDWFGFGSLPMWSAALVVALLVSTSLFVVLRFMLVRLGLFTTIARALLLQGVGRAFGPPAVSITSNGWDGLALAELLARSLGIWGQWRRIRRGVGDRLTWPSARAIYSTLCDRRRYPLVLLPSSLIDALAVGLPLPVLLDCYGPSAAGVYAVAWRLAGVPAQLLSGAFADIFHHAAQAYNAGASARAGLRSVVRSALGRNLLIGSALFLPAAAIAPWVFGPLFGQQFAQGGIMFAILAPAALAAFAVGPLTRVLVVLDRPELKLRADAVALAGAVIPVYAASAAGLGLTGAAWAICVGGVCGSVAYLAAVWRATSGDLCA